MRLVSLVLVLCLITSFAFADVKAKIVDIKRLDRDYIWIEIEYDIDGRKVTNTYPMDFKNIAGKTDQEITDWVDINIDYQIDRYIETDFRKNVNDSIIQQKLQSLVGKEYTKKSAILEFDINNDGIADTEWTIKQDGSYVEKSINN